MQLLVDVGNSRIKWAYWDGSQLSEPRVAQHRGTNFDRLLHYIWGDIVHPHGVMID